MALILPSPQGGELEPTPEITVLPMTPLAPLVPTATEQVVPSATETAPPEIASTATFGPSPTLGMTSTPLASATPSGPILDPYTSWGQPNLLDELDSPANWVGVSGELPDTDYLRLAHTGEQLLVTGKQLLFETWWFTWPVLRNFYLEMTVQTSTCSGSDTYGVILRGPASGTSTAHGYIVGFTCDGSYRLRRVDSTSPTYQAVDLISITPNTAIRAGANQTNVLGVRAEGGLLTLYANGYQLAQYTDTSYGDGRFGIYVRSGASAVYTYRLERIAYWVLD